MHRSGYVCRSLADAGGQRRQSATYNGTAGLAGNLCYRTRLLGARDGDHQCDPDLVPKPVAAAPPRACPPPPAAAPAAARAASAEDHAGLEGAVRLRQGGAEARRQGGDRQRDHRQAAGVQKLELVLVTGHTDRIGTQEYNQKLSERRADAVRDYLVSKGVAKDKIETLGMGKTQPVPGVVCNQKNFKAKIACYPPNRRVEVEVKGEMVQEVRLRPQRQRAPLRRGFFLSATGQNSP